MPQKPSGTEGLRRSRPAEVRIPSHGVWVLESHHDRTFEMAMGRWPFEKICWVAVGKGALELKDGEVPIGRGDFLLLPAEAEHRFVDSKSDPLTLVIVCLDDRFFRASGRDEPHRHRTVWRQACESLPLGRPRRARSAFQHSELAECFKVLLREQSQRNRGWELASVSAAGQLLVHLLRSCDASDDVKSDKARAVEGVVEYLDANFHKKVQLADLAERCEMSPRRFTDLFRKRTGQSLTEYVNQRRIAHAKERLLETEHILYSCHESGFRDLGYFYRVFKKHTGLTPGGFLAGAGSANQADSES